MVSSDMPVDYQHLRPSDNRRPKCAYDLAKIENRSRNRSHKLDGIEVGRSSETRLTVGASGLPSTFLLAIALAAATILFSLDHKR